MAEWTHAEICTLIDERRTRNDEFHNLGRNRERFWVLLRVRSIKRIGHHSAVINVKKNSRILSGIIIQSQSPPISRRQSPFVSRRQFLPVRERRSELPPVSSLTTNDEMDIFDTEQLVGQRRTSTHEELSLSLYPPPSYDIATAQESSNVRGNIQ
ncbi:unnamed protein product [Rhizophagus irregularis]|nr:unnamed protein product [Rhizophagus irregularis]